MIGRVRLVGMLEGISFILLMGIAMPLKYLADFPAAVKWTGWIHGVLFISYGTVVFIALLNGKISWSKAALAFLAALVPFGPFLMDRKLAADEKAIG